jgi:hypothetical protein
MKLDGSSSEGTNVASCGDVEARNMRDVMRTICCEAFRPDDRFPRKSLVFWSSAALNTMDGAEIFVLKLPGMTEEMKESWLFCTSVSIKLAGNLTRSYGCYRCNYWILRVKSTEKIIPSHLEHFLPMKT